MKDVLAQFQIDALLQDIVGGKVTMNPTEVKEQKKTKPYDFRLPKKFNKEQLRTLMGVYEIFARHLSSYLTGTLRTFCQAEVASIEETKYYEYSNAIAESALIGVLELNPVEGAVLMEISKELAFTIIDKLLGGPGTFDVIDREYTDIEMVLMERLYKNVITYLKDSWSNVAEIKPVFNKFESGGNANRIMHLDEVVVIVVLNVKVKDIDGKVNFCLPYLWLEAINEKLYTRYRMTQSTNKSLDKELSRNTIISQLSDSGVEVEVNLGNATIQLRDLVNMEIGDVIKLKQSTKDNVMVKVGDKTWFYAQMGVKNNQKAVKIVKSLGR
jgi:flagellar motor switch protein FliM